jgi:hypothetical protein
MPPSRARWMPGCSQLARTRGTSYLPLRAAGPISKLPQTYDLSKLPIWSTPHAPTARLVVCALRAAWSILPATQATRGRRY